MASIKLYSVPVLLTLALVAAAGHQTATDQQCNHCDKNDCPPVDNCRAGVVMDSCGCCSICGRLEGERCDNYTLQALAEKDRYGFCGDNMACLLRNDLDDSDESEALCYCKREGAVCGTNGRTYSSVCRLRLETSLNDEETAAVGVAEWGPCETQPTISSAPENVTANVNDDLALSCEVRGYPIPSLIWEFESASTGKKIKLPGDDQMIALQVRGGPEPYMVSSWIQILRVRPSDAGVYSCTVVSKKGIVRAEAAVTVAKRTKTTTVKPNLKSSPPSTGSLKPNKKASPGGSSRNNRQRRSDNRK